MANCDNIDDGADINDDGSYSDVQDTTSSYLGKEV